MKNSSPLSEHAVGLSPGTAALSWKSRLLNRLLPLLPYKGRWASAAAVQARVHKLASKPPAREPVGLGPHVKAVLRHENGWPLYVTSPAAAPLPKTHVIFLHGGGYIEEIVAAHWRFVGRLTREAPTTCLVPIFPLAPHRTARDMVPAMGELVGRILDDVGPGQLTLIGNSSGAGLALASAQWLRNQGRPQPKALVLISPWLDASIRLEEQQEIAPRDPMQNIPGLIEAGRLYAGSLDVSHPFVSPLNGDLQGLAPVTILTGTLDVLHPDSVRLARKAMQAGVQVDLHSTPGLPHNYALFPTPEGDEARGIIAQVIRGRA